MMQDESFRLLKRVTGKKHITIITDGLPAHNDAYKKEFRTLRKPRTEHIRHIKLKGDMNNNKMERLNGEIRQREKTTRTQTKRHSHTQRLPNLPQLHTRT